MHILKIVGLVLFILLGIFLVVFGGYDDSPGAQGLGLLVALFGMWKLYRGMRLERRK
jgi:drug/metabolite transporter (DMT)-like permease